MEPTCRTLPTPQEHGCTAARTSMKPACAAEVNDQMRDVRGLRRTLRGRLPAPPNAPSGARSGARLAPGGCSRRCGPLASLYARPGSTARDGGIAGMEAHPRLSPRRLLGARARRYTAGSRGSEAFSCHVTPTQRKREELLSRLDLSCHGRQGARSSSW